MTTRERAPVTTEQFIAAWQSCEGMPSKVREVLGYSSDSAVCNRRTRVERERGITLVSKGISSSRSAKMKKTHGERRVALDIEDGTIIIGSDAHVWPGPLTTAQRGFIVVAARVDPTVVIMNGDVFDGAKISRHPAGIWEQNSRPNVKQELEACQEFLSAVQKAAPNAKHLWTWGNHDARIEYTLAALVPEYNGVPGFALKDHFPSWEFCMAIFVNDRLVVKHRYANGAHAVYNNAVKSGRSMATGHLHSLKVTPWTDYNGTRYGIDTGTLADPASKQFDYSEENPANHRAGFVVLTVRGGKLLYPEVCQVWDDDHVEFRGELIPV